MSEANKLYQVNGEDAFKDAEPYYFGNKMPPTGLFRPLPIDDNPSTSENEQEWYQEGQLNGFSTNVPLDGYRHNGAKLSYIKKGTFPKAGKNQLRRLFSGSWEVGGTTDYKITLDGNNIKISGINGNTTNETLRPSDFGLTTTPKRLGILLVGAGGGSGGLTWYDPDKNGKESDQYIVSGSGGGGGGLIWGVIDTYALSVLPNSYYLVRVGNAGAAGANANQSGLSHKKPKYGANGTNGTDTTLYFEYNVGEYWTLAVAGGGKCGSRGNFQSYAVGGDGGTCSCPETAAVFVYCDHKNGGQGCSCNTESIPQTAAWNATIKFAQTDDNNYITTINYEAVSAVLQGGLNNEAEAHKVPGGHSYHPGSTSVDGAGGDDTTNDFKTNVYGRGGAGGHTTQVGERGAPGCFALFY